MRNGLFAFAVLLALVASGAEKKFISFAWEYQERSARDLLAVSDQFAKLPYDGIGIYLYGRNPDGKAFANCGADAIRKRGTIRGR